MDGKIGWLNPCVRPNTGHQLLFANELAWLLDQRDEDFQSTTAKAKRPIAFQQKALGREQSEGAKADCHGDRTFVTIHICKRMSIWMQSTGVSLGFGVRAWVRAIEA
jgi:hypothetical protein